MTLLEVVIASTMLAMLLTSVSVILRTTRASWDAHEADFTRLEAAHATVRHIVREIRQAKSVVAITAATEGSGGLSLQNSDGNTVVWDHDSASKRVNYGANTADHLLSPNVDGLRLVGYRVDGATQTDDPTLVQCIRVDVTVVLPRESNGTRTISSWAWLRSWQ